MCVCVCVRDREREKERERERSLIAFRIINTVCELSSIFYKKKKVMKRNHN